MTDLLISVECGEKTCGICNLRDFDEGTSLCVPFNAYLPMVAIPAGVSFYRCPACLAAEAALKGLAK